MGVNKMSLQKFLFIYYGVSYSTTINMRHEDVLEVLNFVVRTSFDYADKNPDLISTGKIVYVYDKSGRAFPYLIPEVIYECEPDDQELDESLFEKKRIEQKQINLDELSLYELKQLLIANRNRYGIRRKILKEIKGRNGQKRIIKRKEYIYD